MLTAHQQPEHSINKYVCEPNVRRWERKNYEICMYMSMAAITAGVPQKTWQQHLHGAPVLFHQQLCEFLPHFLMTVMFDMQPQSFFNQNEKTFCLNQFNLPLLIRHYFPKKMLLRASVMEKPVGFGKTRCLRSLSRQVLMNVIFLHLFFPTSSQPFFFLNHCFRHVSRSSCVPSFFPRHVSLQSFSVGTGTSQNKESTDLKVFIKTLARHCQTQRRKAEAKPVHGTTRNIGKHGALFRVSHSAAQTFCRWKRRLPAAQRRVLQMSYQANAPLVYIFFLAGSTWVGTILLGSFQACAIYMPAAPDV